MPAPEKFLKIQEIADRLGVHRSSVSRLLSAGIIPSIQIGDSPRVDPVDFEAWIAEQKAASAKKPPAVPAERRPVGRPRKPGLPKRPADDDTSPMA